MLSSAWPPEPPGAERTEGPRVIIFGIPVLRAFWPYHRPVKRSLKALPWTGRALAARTAGSSGLRDCFEPGFGTAAA